MKTACQNEYTDVLRYGRKFIYNAEWGSWVQLEIQNYLRQSEK